MVFENGLSVSAEELYCRLFTTDFDPVSLRKDLEAGKYNAEDVNSAALEYVDDCTCQFLGTEYDDKLVPGEIIPWIESGHVKDAIELLLDFGLDPNRIYQEKYGDNMVDEYNIMQQLYLIDNGFQGADALYLLLSHGGNPNLVVNRQCLLSEPYYDLWFDSVNRDMLYASLYHAKIHYCMVLIGFGARFEDGKEPLDPSSYFWIEPVKVIDYSNTDDDDNVAAMSQLQISIEEDDVDQYLMPFLGKYFDDDLKANRRRIKSESEEENGSDIGFEWYLTYNFFTFDSILKMLKDISDTMDALASGQENEYTQELRIKRGTATYQLIYARGLSEEQIKEYNNNRPTTDNTEVGVVIDFYRRFIYRMEYMVKVGKEKGYDLISFMGP